MNLSENIHNAFKVVFKTLEASKNLMEKCRNEYDRNKYYMPVRHFLRYQDDSEWAGWIYWSIILLYQRKEDGKLLENGWIDGPVYAVEINLDADIYKEPVLNIAKFEFSDMDKRGKKCSSKMHYIFNDIMYSDDVGSVDGVEKQVIDDNHFKYTVDEWTEELDEDYWGFKEATVEQHKLVDIKVDNYQEKIFGSIEKLHEGIL